MKTIHSTENCKRLTCLILAVLTIASILLLPANATVAHAAEKIVTIPNPDQYFGKLDTTVTTKNHTDYKYNVGSDTKAVEKKITSYIDALEDCGLKLVKRASIAYEGKITGKHYEVKRGDEKAVDILWVYSTGKVSVQVFSGVKIGAVNTNSDAEPAPASQSGSGERKRCFWCGGDGKCSDCGGSGYRMKWVAGTTRDYVQQNCTSCYSPGKCRDCGGSGWE